MIQERALVGSLVLAGVLATAAGTSGCTQGFASPTPPGFSGSAGSIFPDGGGGFTGGPEPAFASTVTAAMPPPPISGGTLMVLSDGTTAVAADSDRDAIYVVDVESATMLAAIALQPHDEPGRLVQDGAGLVHVALRGAGAVVTIDPAAGTIVGRQAFARRRAASPGTSIFNDAT